MVRVVGLWNGEVVRQLLTVFEGFRAFFVANAAGIEVSRFRSAGCRRVQVLFINDLLGEAVFQLFTVLKRLRALAAAGAAVVVERLVGAGCAGFQILRIGVLLIEHVCGRGERCRNDLVALHGRRIVPARKDVVVLVVSISDRGLAVKVRFRAVGNVFVCFKHGAVPVFPRHGICVDSIVKLRCVGHRSGNGGNHRIPVISAVGVLRVVCSGRRRAAVDRRCAVFNLVRVEHGVVPVFPGDRVFVDGAVIRIVLVIDRVIGHVACAEFGQGIERGCCVRVGVPADGGVGVLRVCGGRRFTVIDRHGADHGACGTGKRFVAVFPRHGHVAVIQGIVVRVCSHSFGKRDLGVPADVGIGGSRPADEPVVRVGAVAEGRVFRRNKGVAVGIGPGCIRRVGIAVIEVDGVGVELQRVCGDRRISGDGDFAAACGDIAVHLQHRRGLVIAGFGCRRDGDFVAPGVGAAFDAGNRCAGARGHGDGMQRFEFGRDFDQVDVHLPGQTALLASVVGAVVGADEAVAVCGFDIRDFIGVFKFKVLIEIVDVVGHLCAVDIDVRGEEVDVVEFIFAVEHRVHVELLLDLLPRQVKRGIVGHVGHFAEALRHQQAVCAGRHAAGNNLGRNGDRFVRVRRQEPMVGGVASAGRVGRIEGAVVFAVPIDVRTAGRILEFQVEHEQIPVPVEDREPVGSAADGNAPGVFAIVAGKAGTVVQVVFADAGALRVAHCNIVVVIHIVADVAAVGNDGERTSAGDGARVVGVRDIIRRSAIFDFTDQTAVVATAGDGAPVEAVGHVRVVVGAAAQIAGLAGDAAVRAVVVVVIGFNRTRVPAAADVGVVIGAAEDTAGVVIRLDSADVPALLDDRFALVAVAEDAARRVVCGRDGAAVAAVVEFMIGVLAVAEDTADGVFARHVAGVIAVVELVQIVFHIAEDTTGVVVVAANIAIVFVVAPDTGADVAADDAARVIATVDIPAVDVVYDRMFGVRIKHTGDAAGDLGARFDITGVDAAGQRHLFILVLGAEIADDAARAGVGRHLAGVGAVCERGFVVFDPARDAAGVAVAGIDLAGVGAAVCNHAALAVANHTGRTVMVRIDERTVGAVGQGQRAVCLVFADQTADVIVTIDGTAFDMHVFKGQIPVAPTDENSKAVLSVIVVVVNKSVFKIHVFERRVLRRAEQAHTVVVVCHIKV